MKICIAQTQSLKRKIQENIDNHLQMIKHAIKLDADLIIFPELSITGYEPSIAKELATDIDNPIFNAIQLLCDKNEIVVGLGIPTNHIGNIKISMGIFQPNKKRTIYSKQILHTDELAYFSCGNSQMILEIKNKKIAIAICYEALQREHFLNAKKKEAQIYIASVAKSQAGIKKAYEHFSKIAKEFKTPVLMSNCVGYCDNFLSVGQSAVWDENGKLIGQLDKDNQEIMIYDTEMLSSSK